MLECRGCALRRVWRVECLVQKRWNWNLNIEESELELEVSGIVNMSRTFAAVGWPQEPRFVDAFVGTFVGAFENAFVDAFGAFSLKLVLISTIFNLFYLPTDGTYHYFVYVCSQFVMLYWRNFFRTIVTNCKGDE